MHYYEVAPNKIFRADCDFFTYHSNSPIQIGTIVLVEIGKKQAVGVVLRTAKKPKYETKPIKEIVEDNPLPGPILDLSIWLSKYYITPLALVLQTILPSGIQKKRRIKNIIQNIPKRDRTNIVLNSEQLSIINTLKNHSNGTFLLQGITGSGKTAVYIEIAKQAIRSGTSAIIIVPEIALTSQLIAEFSNYFNNILLTHSKMTETARHLVWLEALNSQEPRVVIGPRSALFTPLKKVGTIIIDEAHEPSLKQEQAPKYSALRVATILGRLHKSKVIFGSATPNIIDRYLAEKSDLPILKLTQLARKDSKPSNISLVDMTKHDNFTNHRFLSNQLIEEINKTLKNKKQALIFHNRRGSTHITLCKECGWTTECPNCFLPLTLHMDSHQMRCHTCGYITKVPTSCPSCNSTNVIHKGIGTKLIETEIKKLFPNANVARFDADNKTDETVNSRYDDLYDGTIDIAIGTQIIAKGLDLPHLRTVGVIQADNGLAIPDFSSNERTFQLLAQVVGRVGRNEHQTQIVIQSYQPNHPSIQYGINQDYESFYKQTLIERRHGLFPPFTHLLKLTCIYKTESVAIKNSKDLAKILRNTINKDVQILGPAPAFYERSNGLFKWQLILKSPKREYLIDAIKLVPSTHWQVELDPNSLL